MPAADCLLFQNDLMTGTYDKNVGIGSMIVRVTEFTIDNDWDKVIRKQFRPKYKYRR